MEIKLSILQVFTLIHCLNCLENTVIRQTSLGKINGVRTLVPGSKDKYVDQFRKIPYAAPPVGDLRFSKPIPYGKWDGTLDGTKFGASCNQIAIPFTERAPNKLVSEDCLHLNIYAPSDVADDTKLPVMVWIHGGGFYYGQGSFYNASNLVSSGNVIVVTINYRLGIFGFFTLNDPIANGNYGLWDQILALKWVNEHIGSFNGDSDSVTIFGESAGGMSVNLLSLIPSNLGLFHRVIVQSGPSTSPLLMANNSFILTKSAGKSLGCHIRGENGKNDFLNCMRKKSAEDITNIADFKKIPKPRLMISAGFGPVVDGELFPDQPLELLSGSYPDHLQFFRSLDLVTGVTSGEGSLMIGFLSNPDYQKQYSYSINIGIPTHVVCEVIAKAVVDGYFSNNARIKAEICSKYSDTDESPELQSLKAADVYADFMFNSPTVLLANIHSQNENVKHTFLYRLSRVNPVVLGSPLPKWFTRSAHGNDLLFLFGLQNYQDVPEDDLQLSEHMMLYWANFAHYGNVNGYNSSLPVWPIYDSVNQLFVNLDTEIATEQFPFSYEVQFWSQTIPALFKNHLHDPSEL